MSQLRAFAGNIWIANGETVRDFGVLFTTRMTIVRLSNGSIWVSSPVSVSFQTLARISELGPVQYLISGTPRHVWRLEAWHTLFPEAQLWVPRSTPSTLKRKRLCYTGVLSDAPPGDWADDLDQLAFRGNPLIEEVFFFHRESRTVILDDLIQNHPVAAGKPVRNAFLRLAGVQSPSGGVPLDIRLSFIHRNLARKSLDRLLSWDFEKLILAHGACVESGAREFVEHAFRWLLR